MTVSLTPSLEWRSALSATLPPSVGLAMLRPRISGVTLIAVILMHVGLLMGVLLNTPKMAMPIALPQPLTVSLIQPEVQKLQPQPEPKPSLPKPIVKTLPPPPVLAVARPVSTPHPAVEMPKPDSQPEPVPEVLPPPIPIVTEAPKPAPSLPSPPRPADYLNNPKPPYPALSRRLGEEGVVRLNILVNEEGSVERLKLAQSSGYERLDQSAMNIVQSSWKFEPARQDGKPVAAWVIVPIHFTLR